MAALLAVVFVLQLHGNGMSRLFWGGHAVAVSGTSSGPFDAFFAEERILRQPDGTEVKKTETGRIFADSAGRVRKEVRVDLGSGASDLHLAILFDAARGEPVVLDVSTGVVIPRGMPLPIGPAAAPFTGPAPSPAPKQGSLDLRPERVIEGYVCHAVKTVGPDEVSETWISDDLAQVVEETRNLSSGERVFYRLHDIRRGEPDPALFAALTANE